ncbi:MAG: carbohydrate ABC transporter permease [Burkholderiales bacterium]
MSGGAAARAGAPWRTRALLRRILNAAVTAAVCVAALFPILWGLSTSLKSASGILEYPPSLLPSPPTLEHYAQLFGTGIHRYLWNSAVVSALTVALCVILAALAAYALARFEFKGKGPVMFVIVAVMSIPLPSLTVPTFTFLALVGLTNTLTGLVLLYTAYQLPLAVWVLYGYFKTIPTEYENAAMVDGYSRFAALRKVVLPLSAPGLIAAGLFTLTFAWNDFVVAVAMNSSDDVRTLPVAIYNYLGFFGREWGPLTAAAMVSIVPVIVVFVIFQKYFLSGMTGGGVKG